MIGIDTNLLVRYFVQDDARQVRQVDELIDLALRTGERLRISDIMLSELVWVLKTIYRMTSPGIPRSSSSRHPPARAGIAAAASGG